MAIIFADPFGSFLDGFERGQDQAIEKRRADQDYRIRELELYDKFVFQPNQQLAREQRAMNRQMTLMEARRSQTRTSRDTAKVAAEVDASTKDKRSRDFSMGPARITIASGDTRISAADMLDPRR